MADLTHDAERALLGALLKEPARLGQASSVQASDFTDPRHQAIFGALAGGSKPANRITGRLREWIAQLRLRGVRRETEQYMSELPGACPNPANIDAYVAMVISRRQKPDNAGRTAAQADQLANAAAWLTSSRTGRLPAPGDHGVSQQTGKLARALQSAVRNMISPAVIPPAPAPSRAPEGNSVTANAHRPAPDQGASVPEPAATDPGPRADAPPDVESLSIATLEELVLADLMRRPADARDVIGWLPADAFTSPERRVTYELTSSLIAEGQPADPLIIAWEAAKINAGQLDPQYVLNIGKAHPAHGTAAVLGRTLYASHVCERRFGPQWVSQPAHELTAPQPAEDRQPQETPVAANPAEPSTRSRSAAARAIGQSRDAAGRKQPRTRRPTAGTRGPAVTPKPQAAEPARPPQARM